MATRVNDAVTQGATGERLEALVQVELAAATSPARFDGFRRDEPVVRAAWQVVGSTDFVLHLACPDLPALHEAVNRMRRVGGAAETVTHLVLRPVEISIRAPGGLPDTPVHQRPMARPARRRRPPRKLAERTVDAP
jgi:DNA-binding Lrp family transcriptional regulator